MCRQFRLGVVDSKNQNVAPGLELVTPCTSAGLLTVTHLHTVCNVFYRHRVCIYHGHGQRTHQERVCDYLEVGKPVYQLYLGGQIVGIQRLS